MFIVVSLEIIEHLTCPACNAYLSTSVKIYRNGGIKCVRCSKDNDGGITSRLYQTIFKGARFPCVNHYSGCRELLYSYEVLQHESICSYKFLYDCFLCSRYNPSTAYNLQYHLDRAHQDFEMVEPEFSVNLHSPNQSLCHWYKETSLVSFIVFKYEPESFLFTFNVICAMQEPFRNVKYRFSLFNSDDVWLFRSFARFCRHCTEFKVDLATVLHMVPNKIIVVRFELFEKDVLMVPENITYLNSTLSTATFRCTFNNITSFRPNDSAYSKPYYVGDLPWQLEISQRLKDEEPYLAIFLTTENDISYTYNVNASFTLVSTEAQDSKTDYFGKDFQNLDGGGFDDVIKWRYLVDSNFGYVEDDTITIDVWLDVGAEQLQGYRRGSEYDGGKSKKRVRFV